MPGARTIPIAIASFVLGACAAAAVGSRAAPSTPGLALPTRTQAAVIHPDEAEQRRSPAKTAVVTILALGRAAFIGRLELAAGAAIPEHSDPTEEYVFVLAGAGTMTIDGIAHDVAAGDTIYMPPDVRVSFVNGDAPMIALQVFAGPEPARKYEGWSAL